MFLAIGIIEIIIIIALLCFIIKEHRRIKKLKQAKAGESKESKIEININNATPSAEVTPTTSMEKDKAPVIITTEPIQREELEEEETVRFKAKDKTFAEQIEALSKEQYWYFMTIRKHALQIPGIEEQETKTAINFKSNKKLVFKLNIQRSTTTASFKFEQDILKGFKRSVGASASAIRQKDTKVLVTDDESMNIVFGMIDLVLEQHEKERQLAAERKRAQQQEKRAKTKEATKTATQKKAATTKSATKTEETTTQSDTNKES